MAVTWDTLTYDNNGYSGLISDNFLKVVDDLGEQRKLFLTGTNELLKTFQQLNLNDSEFSGTGIVPKYMSMFDNIITDYNMNGDVGGAYNDLMALTRKMYSSPDLIGRVRANASYEDFKKRVDDNKTLSQDYKNWLLEISPYNYVDGPEDENGNPTFGDTWKPTREPVDNIPISEIYEKACKYVSSESGGYVGAYFLNAAGNPTRKYNDSKDKWLYKATDTGMYERISYDDMLKAIHTTIASDPAMSASLHQDFDYNIYRYDKEVAKQQQNSDGVTTPVIQKGITDENGRVINDFNAYLENIVDPVASLASYTNVKPNFSSSGTISAKNGDEDNKELSKLPEGSTRMIIKGQTYNVVTADNGDTLFYQYNPNTGKYRCTRRLNASDSNQREQDGSTKITGGGNGQSNSNATPKLRDGQSNPKPKSDGNSLIGGLRYGYRGSIRHIAALGTEIDSGLSDEDMLEAKSIIDDNSMHNSEESEGAWDRKSAIHNIGNTEIKINTWDVLDNTKRDAENLIMQFLNEFEPEIARQCSSVNGLIKSLSERGKTLDDFYQRTADLYCRQYGSDWEGEPAKPILMDRLNYNIYATYALKGAVDTYNRTDSIMNKYVNDHSENHINLPFFRPTGLERIGRDISNPTVADALSFSKCANRQIYDGDDQFTKELVNEINNVFTKDTMREYDLTIGGNVWRHYLTQNSWDSAEDCPIPAKRNTDGSYTLHLDNNCANLVPKLMYQLDIADDACEGWNPWAFFKKHNQGSYYDDDCYGVTGSNATFHGVPYSHETSKILNENKGLHAGRYDKHRLQRLGEMYKAYMDLVEQAKNNVGVSCYSFLQNWASDCPSEGAFYATCYPMGRTSSGNSTEVDKRNELFYKSLSGTDFSQGYMEIYNDAGVAEKTYEQQKYNDIIHEAVINGWLNSKFCPLYTYADSDGKLQKGYLFTIHVPDKDNDGEKVPKILKDYIGKDLKIFTSGAIDEGYNVAIGANPVARTDQQYNMLSNNQVSFIPNIGYAQGIGDTRFDINKDTKNPKDKYNAHLFQMDFQFDDYDAKNLSELLFECESLKGFYSSNSVNTESDIDRNIEYLVTKLCDILINTRINHDDPMYVTNDEETFNRNKYHLSVCIEGAIKSYIYYNNRYTTPTVTDVDANVITSTNNNKNVIMDSGYLKR